LVPARRSNCGGGSGNPLDTGAPSCFNTPVNETYRTYWFLIRLGAGTRLVEFPATSLDAARADMAEAFANLEIITCGSR